MDLKFMKQVYINILKSTGVVYSLQFSKVNLCRFRVHACQSKNLSSILQSIIKISLCTLFKGLCVLIAIPMPIIICRIWNFISFRFLVWNNLHSTNEYYVQIGKVFVVFKYFRFFNRIIFHERVHLHFEIWWIELHKSKNLNYCLRK